MKCGQSWFLVKYFSGNSPVFNLPSLPQFLHSSGLRPGSSPLRSARPVVTTKTQVLSVRKRADPVPRPTWAGILRLDSRGCQRHPADRDRALQLPREMWNRPRPCSAPSGLFQMPLQVGVFTAPPPPELPTTNYGSKPGPQTNFRGTLGKEVIMNSFLPEMYSEHMNRGYSQSCFQLQRR